MIIKNIARLLVFLVLMVALLLASNKHGCQVVIYDKNSDTEYDHGAFHINFWWVLGASAVMSALLWIGGFFG